MKLTQPGSYSYRFSLVAYEENISDTFEFFIDPCSVTSFLNKLHDPDVETNGLYVTMP
jgi:hypothetical protein